MAGIHRRIVPRRFARPGHPRAGLGGCCFRITGAGFPGCDRRHADGCRNGHRGARSGNAGPLLRPRRGGGGAAVGAGIRRFVPGGGPGGTRAGASATADQYSPGYQGRCRPRAGLFAPRVSGGRRRSADARGRVVVPGLTNSLCARSRTGASSFRGRTRRDGRVRPSCHATGAAHGSDLRGDFNRAGARRLA